MAKLKFKLVVERDDDNQNKEALPVEPGTAAKALSRQLRITALTTILALGMVIAVTVAWFAMNREVQSDGMQMEVQTTANLVIVPVKYNGAAVTSSTATVYDLLISNATAKDNDSATFIAESVNLIPITHQADVGLVYVNNASAVDAGTGYLAAGKLLDTNNGSYINSSYIDAVPSDADGTQYQYYLEYEVQIACDSPGGAPLAASKLVATFSSSQLSTLVSKDYQRASSVAFYAGYGSITPNDDSTSQDYNYKGTLNLQGYDPAVNNGTSLTSLDLLTLTGGVVPLKSATPITVIMRFYFDGDLQKSTYSLVHASGTADANTTYYNASDEPVTTGITVGETDVSEYYIRSNSSPTAFVRTDLLATGGMPTLTVNFEAVE